MNIEIRKYNMGEEKILNEIYISSIRENAKDFYTKSQIEVWISTFENTSKYEEKIGAINPYVIIKNNEILGYADLQEDGFINHFFVKGNNSRKGIGSYLMSFIIEEAKKRKILKLSSNVSLAAQEFFKKFGFEISSRKKVMILGVELENAHMISNV